VTEITVRVAARRLAANSVIVLDLVANRGGDLPAWEPGAHIDIVLPRGGERQYSLLPSPSPDVWRIGVLRSVDGRGGSAWLHDEVEVGRTIRARGPQNHFSFAPVAGTPYLFLAAGIGITPLLSMVVAASAAGVFFELHYSGRTRSGLALLDEVPGAVIHVSDEGSRLDLAAVIASLDPATAIYCCGPAHFIEAVEAAAGSHPLHVERFEAKTLGAPVWEGDFEVELLASGETLVVPPGRSILEVVEEAGVFILSSCREGTCGTCETEVIEGEIDHRDSILTPDEQATNRVMYPCVSRAACSRLVLEL
jgi:ferredoxin-NADP reductase